MIKNHTELRVDLRRCTLIDIKALRMGMQIDSTVPGAGAGEIPRAVLTQRPSRRCVRSVELPVATGTRLSNVMESNKHYGSILFCAQWSCVLRMQRLHVNPQPSETRTQSY